MKLLERKGNLMARKGRVRSGTIKVRVIADSLAPFDIETNAFNIGEAVRAELDKRGRVWVEAIYFIDLGLETERRGTLYSRRS